MDARPDDQMQQRPEVRVLTSISATFHSSLPLCDRTRMTGAGQGSICAARPASTGKSLARQESSLHQACVTPKRLKGLQKHNLEVGNHASPEDGALVHAAVCKCSVSADRGLLRRSWFRTVSEEHAHSRPTPLHAAGRRYGSRAVDVFALTHFVLGTRCCCLHVQAIAAAAQPSSEQGLLGMPRPRGQRVADGAWKRSWRQIHVYRSESKCGTVCPLLPNSQGLPRHLGIVRLATDISLGELLKWLSPSRGAGTRSPAQVVPLSLPGMSSSCSMMRLGRQQIGAGDFASPCEPVSLNP